MKNRINTIVCDMEGTLVNYDIGNFGGAWDTLFKILGLERESNSLLKKYYPKRELYYEWLDKAVRLLKGKKVSDGLNELFPIQYSKGVKEFFINLNSNYKKVILTNGINLIADKIKEELNFDFSYSTILNYSRDIFDGTYEFAIPLWNKEKKLIEISKTLNFRLEETCFVGDGINDIPCFKIVELPVAYAPRVQFVKKYAKHIISDFRELEKIL